jgi:tRNA(fMet)-specific endonuclease VapC
VTRILLDTSAYSAFFRGHAGVVAALQEADEIALTPVVLGELRAGFVQGKRRAENQRELAEFLASPRVFVYDVDAETAIRYAAVVQSLRSAGTPIPTNDIWIAASALQHGFSVVTTDSEHFGKVANLTVEGFVP